MTAAHRLEDQVTAVEEEVSGFARAVALRRAGISAVAGGLLMFLVATHWITPGLSGHLTGLLNSGLGFATTVGAGAWIHRGTTPAAQALWPRNNAGQNLVPDPSAGDALAGYSSDPAVGAAFDDAVAAGLAPGTQGADSAGGGAG